MKRTLAEVIQNYFNELNNLTENVPSENVVNYDESFQMIRENVTVIAKGGAKHYDTYG